MLKSKIHVLTNIQGLFLLVYEDAQGHKFEALSPNGEVYRHSEIYYNAASAKAKGRLWIQQLMTEDFWNPCLHSSPLEPKVSG